MTEKLDGLLDQAMKYRFTAAVILIFLTAFGLRYYPVRNLEYLQALDPYNLFRMSQQIAYTGSLPDLDFMRWFPYATPTYVANQVNLWLPAGLYSLGGFLFFENYLSFAQFITPLYSGVSAVLMYFLGKELYDRYAGLSAAFIIAILPGAMYRGSAGFFEKEPVGTMFMMASLLFFTYAWKRKNWIYGIIAGLALGGFTASWGGSQMLWLLYPMVIGFMLLINEATEEMIASYTPTVIFAAVFAAIVNPGNFWFTDTESLMNLGFLGLLWMRYLVEQFELLEESKLDYLMPSTYFAGAIALALSPLYSQALADIAFSIYRSATQTGTGVIGGTVAENAATDMSSLISQLGSGVLDGIFPGASLITALFGAWTLIFMAMPLMLTGLYMKLGNKYGLVNDSISGKRYYAMLAGMVTAWAIGFTIFFEGLRAVGIISGLVVSVALTVMALKVEEESAFNINSIALIFTALIASIYAIRQGSVQQVGTILRGIAYPLWIAAGGLGLIYVTDNFNSVSTELQWYKILPIFWLGTNLLGTTARSRLIYLSTFAVALGAGYTFSKVIRKIQSMDFSELDLESSNVRYVMIGLLIVGVVSVNAAAGFLSVQGISGSPNEAWMQNLEHLEEEAPEGSVTMSWWDYGYHFQSIGRTGTIADGGNFRYYTSGEPINFPLAEYFASNDTRENYGELFEKHSVDYVVLDNTMIGKYSAVSQIANRDNQNFDSMFQASTPGTLQQSVSQSGNRTVAQFQGRVGAQAANIYVPLTIDNTTVDVSDTATIQTARGGNIEASCVLTDQGIEEFGDGESQFCIAEDPYFNMERSLSAGIQSRIALIPRDISDHNLMRLYFMDGHGMDYVEKVEGGSNDYVKLWEVTE